MRVKYVIDEDFVNYRKPSMFIGTAFCDWKCCTEIGIDTSICQNHDLAKSEIIEITPQRLYERYSTNTITKAIVIGGLEPFLQFDEVMELIRYFRERSCNDDFVIYTGYNKIEKAKEIELLKQYPCIIVKFGRYHPNEEKHFDKVLGIDLISGNQYAERIS